MTTLKIPWATAPCGATWLGPSPRGGPTLRHRCWRHTPEDFCQCACGSVRPQEIAAMAEVCDPCGAFDRNAFARNAVPKPDA